MLGWGGLRVESSPLIFCVLLSAPRSFTSFFFSFPSSSPFPCPRSKPADKIVKDAYPVQTVDWQGVVVQRDDGYSPLFDSSTCPRFTNPKDKDEKCVAILHTSSYIAPRPAELREVYRLRNDKDACLVKAESVFHAIPSTAKKGAAPKLTPDLPNGGDGRPVEWCEGENPKLREKKKRSFLEVSVISFLVFVLYLCFPFF